MKYIKISKCDIANGPGVRTVLWVSGCNHYCKNCHNPDTWNYHFGKDFNKEAHDYLFECLSKSYIQGITFSGGDPLYPDNRQGVINLIKEIRSELPSKDIWLYTGYKWEQIKHLDLDIDVLVDGPFIEQEKDISLLFRGSKNQRLIDVKKTKETDLIVIYNENQQ